MVTHPTTDLPIWCLSMAERTGCPVLTSLWSYVFHINLRNYILQTVCGSLTSWVDLDLRRGSGTWRQYIPMCPRAPGPQGSAVQPLLQAGTLVGDRGDPEGNCGGSGGRKAATTLILATGSAP